MTTHESWQDGNPMAKPVRYAVIGIGHIAQVAILPAFRHADNSVLAAIVTDDETKRVELGERYGVEHCVSYSEFEPLLSEGLVDAVYIALPNHLHCEYTVRAAQHGVHVLCEKPMAVTEEECQAMIDAAHASSVQLMVAYRLHFERANLEAIRIVEQGELGKVRAFESFFSQNVKPDNVRLMPIGQGGGSVYDMGIYCINAARYLFRAEPLRVRASSVLRRTEEGSASYDETTSCILDFPGDRLAAFTSSFGATDVSMFRVVGDDGQLVMDPAYEYVGELGYEVTTANGHRTRRTLGKRDQFGPQLYYFSDCIQRGRRPEPDGAEGLLDVRVIRAIHRAAESGQAVDLPPIVRSRRPDLNQQIERPGFDKPREVHASAPSE